MRIWKLYKPTAAGLALATVSLGAVVIFIVWLVVSTWRSTAEDPTNTIGNGIGRGLVTFIASAFALIFGATFWRFLAEPYQIRLTGSGSLILKKLGGTVTIRVSDITAVERKIRRIQSLRERLPDTTYLSRNPGLIQSMRAFADEDVGYQVVITHSGGRSLIPSFASYDTEFVPALLALNPNIRQFP